MGKKRGPCTPNQDCGTNLWVINERKRTKTKGISAIKARFKRRILHVPNLMQMNENNRFFSCKMRRLERALG